MTNRHIQPQTPSKWERVGKRILSGYPAPLYHSKTFPFLWKWNENYVLADTESAAVARFEKQAQLCPDQLYWERWGSPGFRIYLGRLRSRLYRHKYEPNFWLWNDYAFYVESPLHIDRHLKAVFRKQDSIDRDS